MNSHLAAAAAMASGARCPLREAWLKAAALAQPSGLWKSDAGAGGGKAVSPAAASRAGPAAASLAKRESPLPEEPGGAAGVAAPDGIPPATGAPGEFASIALAGCASCNAKSCNGLGCSAGAASCADDPTLLTLSPVWRCRSTPDSWCQSAEAPAAEPVTKGVSGLAPAVATAGCSAAWACWRRRGDPGRGLGGWRGQ